MKGASKYRARARKIIDRIASENAGAPLKEQIKLIDAAYPFGERLRWPYKCWLAERSAFIERSERAAAPPLSEDDAAVCLVAHDLVELGRVAEARKLMDDQAPNRLKRKCPACGARANEQCRDLRVREEGMPLPWPELDPGVPREIPHESRLTGRLGNGPLFGDR